MAGQEKANIVWSRQRQVWEVRWTDTLHGRPRSRVISTGITDPHGKSAAEIFAAEWKAQERQLTKELGEPRVNDIIDRYLNDALARGFVKRNVAQFNVMRREFGACRLSALTQQDFIDFQNRNATKYKAVTLRCHLQRLKTAIRYAHKVGLLSPEIDPVITMPPPQQGRVVFLDEQQEAEYHAIFCGLSIGQKTLSPLTLIACIGLDTGARIQAILQLTWDRIDLRNRTIDFRQPGRVISKKRRVVSPINSRLWPTIERAYNERKGNAVFDKPAAAEKAFGYFVKTTPYPWATAHIMRHTFATLMLNAGVDIVQVAALIGDTPETVLKVYAHTSRKWLHAVADARMKNYQ
jgi:hypothetical protein